MRLTVVRSCLFAGAVGALLPLVAACSGTSTSNTLAPTAPSLVSGATLGEITEPPPPPSDPCAPAGFAGIVETPVCNGRFTGGGFQVNGEVKVTRGFELHCDALLSNNFEVNWPDGNNFHIDKNQAARCTLLANPTPPSAPVNRIDITGTGKLNGVDGATVTLVLVDNGERKGAPPDQAYIEINGVAITGGSVESPAPLDGGNIQAHFDQPHKN